MWYVCVYLLCVDAPTKSTERVRETEAQNNTKAINTVPFECQRILFIVGCELRASTHYHRPTDVGKCIHPEHIYGMFARSARFGKTDPSQYNSHSVFFCMHFTKPLCAHNPINIVRSRKRSATEHASRKKDHTDTDSGARAQTAKDRHELQTNTQAQSNTHTHTHALARASNEDRRVERVAELRPRQCAQRTESRVLRVCDFHRCQR